MSESMYFAFGGAFFGFVASFTSLSKDWAVMVVDRLWSFVKRMEMRMRCGRMERCGGNNVQQSVGYSGNNTSNLLELDESRLTRTKVIITIRRSAYLKHRNPPMISLFYLTHVICRLAFFF